MNYSSKTTSDGKPITADNAIPQVIAGLEVPGNELVYIGMDINKEGEEMESKACLRYEQSNGAIFKPTYLEPKDGSEWQLDRVLTHFKHIATKVVTLEEYEAAINGITNFKEFVKAVSNLVMPKLQAFKSENNGVGQKFDLKIVYSKTGFLQFPAYPNFMRKAGDKVAVPFKYNSKYDLFSPPIATNPEVEAEQKSDKPF